jgi:hypothetical protein
LKELTGPRLGFLLDQVLDELLSKIEVIRLSPDSIASLSVSKLRSPGITGANHSSPVLFGSLPPRIPEITKPAPKIDVQELRTMISVLW